MIYKVKTKGYECIVATKGNKRTNVSKCSSFSNPEKYNTWSFKYDAKDLFEYKCQQLTPDQLSQWSN